MTTLYSTIATALRKRAAYNRIVTEIEMMPLDVALDLDIYRGDARRIAQSTVYGA